MSKHALCLKPAPTGLLFLAASRTGQKSGKVGRKIFNAFQLQDYSSSPSPGCLSRFLNPRSTHEPPTRHGLRWSEHRGYQRPTIPLDKCRWGDRTTRLRQFVNDVRLRLCSSSSVRELSYIEIPSQGGISL
ncbi:hypothetical protein EMPG_12721 [Blastomyces silverae]|uniref:Uncharacterized protein n=1 Tax=Blastomyces silverae TaxID=2060906 RepID=A0A0H1BKZ3_9EURO|nr:hypothetical protein EMPG_12721 [Blastomyces silverae]